MHASIQLDNTPHKRVVELGTKNVAGKNSQTSVPERTASPLKVGKGGFFVSRRFASRIYEVSDLKKALVFSLRAEYTTFMYPKNTLSTRFCELEALEFSTR